MNAWLSARGYLFQPANFTLRGDEAAPLNMGVTKNQPTGRLGYLFDVPVTVSNIRESSIVKSFPGESPRASSS